MKNLGMALARLGVSAVKLGLVKLAERAYGRPDEQLAGLWPVDEEAVYTVVSA